MPGLRRLRDPVRRPGLHAGAGDPAGADRLHDRDRLRRALRLLHGHVRDARHPRPRARARDRPGDDAAGPLDLDRRRRRRRALDRRQPPDPRAAPQRAGEDPALQQPDLRAHEGPGVADERARQDHEVDAVRLARPPLQPARAGARRGGDVRRALARPRPLAPRRGAACGGRARRHRLRRDLPELPRLQRRRVLRPDRERNPRGDARSGSCTASRSASGSTTRVASRAARTATCGSSRSRTSARTRCSSTTPTARTRASRSRSRGSPSARPSRPRSGSSAPSSVRSTAPPPARTPMRPSATSAQLEALLHAGDTWTVA